MRWGHPQCFWNILQFQPFPQAGKEDQRQRESDRYGYGIYHRFAQVVLFLHQEDGHTQDGAVRSNQRQENTERLIKRQDLLS